MAVIGEPQKEFEMIPLKVPIPPQYEPEYVPMVTPEHAPQEEEMPV